MKIIIQLNTFINIININNISIVEIFRRFDEILHKKNDLKLFQFIMIDKFYFNILKH